MSSFTDWNGPSHAVNARMQDIIALTNQYQAVLSKFDEYQKVLTWDTEPTTGSNNSVTSGVIYRALSELQRAIEDTYVKATSLSSYAKLTDITNFLTNDALSDYAKASALSAYVKTDSLNDSIEAYLQSPDALTIKNILNRISDINTLLSSFIQSDSENKVYINATLVDIDTCKAKVVSVRESINIELPEVAARLGGSHTSCGVFYILGMLTDDCTGTAYIRYANSKPFSAIVNFAGGSSTTVDMTALVNTNGAAPLDNLKFHVVKGTDTQGVSRKYLAISATDWQKQIDDVTTVGMFASIRFFVSGINIIPIDTSAYVTPNAECELVSSCEGNKGFNASGLTIENARVASVTTDVLHDTHDSRVFEVTRETKDDVTTSVLAIGDAEGYNDIAFNVRPGMFVKDPETEETTYTKFVTGKDMLGASVPVGCIVNWGVYTLIQNPDGSQTYALEKVPAGWHACDRSPFDVTKFTELAELYPDGKLPAADFMIIKMTGATSTEDTPISPDAQVDYNTLHKLILRNKAAIEAEAARSQSIDNDSVIGNAALHDTISEHGTRLDTAENTISEHGTRLDTAENTISEHGTRLDTAENTISEHGTRLDTAENTISEHGTDITGLNSQLQQLNRQSVVIYNGTVADLPNVTPSTDGTVITNGQHALLNTDTGLVLYVATVDASGNVTWNEVV